MNERISFPLNRKYVATGRNKLGFVLDIFPLDGKAAFSRKVIWGIGAKWFPLARKSVSNSQNKGFVVKSNLHQGEKSFNCEEYLKRKRKKIGFH